MQFDEAKEEFIKNWGALGTSWGINKTVAQIFALLMISPRELSVEEIMEELQISRGNVSMNLRTLIDWGLVYKTTHKGERKEYFYCERDIWAVTRKVAEVRKNREIQPVVKVLEQVSQLEGKETEETKEFKRVMNELLEVVRTTDQTLTYFINSDRTWVSKTILEFLKNKKG
ncbi:GbsR/MarR family transcriptional regulator [Fulvivirga lutea]|uniref:HTH-type transcriptional regulator n=1 Tax=Fulvivirga lutea TaxID=2810512 RepID=A0A974WG29_9BACT|nr:MarR family transcriptional regulator [Fulvivirga lutea]QSE97621.1 MarR family transcriptional regulator [Fulvivirga lutea]